MPAPVPPTDRDAAVTRYLQLRPLIKARLAEAMPADLREEFAAVTPHQVRALLALPREGLSMRQVAAALGVTGATASVLADRLEGQDLARREHDGEDRRVVRLVPTDRGWSLAGRVAAAEQETARLLFDRLSDAQVAAWLDVLETLAAADVLEGAR